MARVCLSKGKQKEFLRRAKTCLGGTWDKVAEVCKVHPRTVRDWAREKYKMSYETMVQLSKITKGVFPKKIRVLPEYWSTKKASPMGGKQYVKLYGPPGTPEGRRKGGLIAQKKFRSDPSFAKRIGFITRKKIKHPKMSSLLAEFFGIMLGDGGIHNDYQISISFNPKEDLKYAYYIQKLITKLFSISSTIRIRAKYGSGDIVVGGKNLVEFLVQHGIKKGNKIAGKVDIPQWIWSLKKYKIACLRGLIDTDGGFYHHKYIVNGKKYLYLKMCFTSYSTPLLKSVTTILEDLDLGPKNTAKNRVYLYSLSRLHRYFEKVGTSNPRYLDIYNNFVSNYK